MLAYMLIVIALAFAGGYAVARDVTRRLGDSASRGWKIAYDTLAFFVTFQLIFTLFGNDFVYGAMEGILE